MKKLQVFGLRLVLSIAFAFVAGWMFFGGLPVGKTLGLAGILLALAYAFEHSRKTK